MNGWGFLNMSLGPRDICPCTWGLQGYVVAVYGEYLEKCSHSTGIKARNPKAPILALSRVSHPSCSLTTSLAKLRYLRCIDKSAKKAVLEKPRLHMKACVLTKVGAPLGQLLAVCIGTPNSRKPPCKQRVSGSAAWCEGNLHRPTR